ncbi:ribbon-helix-helix domain-containing protein [Tranquillimonas alkanivorans]|uniref:ribbon-helix-helix domain-containing protein n=1 Tax=Tranquillimonas alkanivorans TaxID=441119 RepID=UPI001C4345C0|nr:ribbon-helix-helix domain-containing protein [Tranquillimonas alkanivorans]
MPRNMTTVSVSLSDEMSAAVERLAEAGGYDTASEYICDLIRRDFDRQVLRAVLEDGRLSAQDEPMTARTLQSLRDRARLSARDHGGAKQ